MCQRSAQPSSCRNQSDLFRSAVQHGDGCRRRLSIRQTRSPKQARSFWCLFLKKARLFETAHLVHATRNSIPILRPRNLRFLSPILLPPPVFSPLPFQPISNRPAIPRRASHALFPARPEHAEWQGKVYKLNGSEPGYPNLAAATGYGTGPGLKGWNCRHDFYPFFPGIDERAYTDEDLRNIDPPPFEYDGKTYTAYEASQRQRQMETAMRRTKRRIMAADGAGLTDDFTAESIKLRRQREMYREFSHKAHLPTQEDRMQVLGFGHSMSSKAVWAIRNNTFTNAGGEIIIRVNKTTARGVPNSITQVVNKKGGIDRNYYDGKGYWVKQVTNNNHGNPKMHPFGEKGEHAHDIIWGKNGEISRPKRELTQEEREANKDAS